MGKIKGCIFDLDDVIVDTEKYHYQAWKRIAQELGFTLTEEQSEKFRGLSRLRSLEVLLEIGNIELDEEQKRKYRDRKNQWYVEQIMKMPDNEMLPGVLDFFNELKTHNIKIGLASASKNAMIILNRLHIADRFEAVMDGRRVTRLKPDPEIFLRVAEEMRLKPDECVVFECTEIGVEGGLNAKMSVVGIGDAKTLHKAHFVISSMTGFDVKMLVEKFDK